MPQISLYWTDVFLWLACVAVVLYGVHVRKKEVLAANWRKVWESPSASAAAVFLAGFVVVGLLDSVNYRPRLPAIETQTGQHATPRYSPISRSLLDDVLQAAGVAKVERSYSAPFALHLFFKESMQVGDEVVRDYPRLQQAAVHIEDAQARRVELFQLALKALAYLAVWVLLSLLLFSLVVRRHASELKTNSLSSLLRCWLWQRTPQYASLRAVWYALTALVAALLVLQVFGSHYYVLGTDRSGNDVIVQALKSVRTALVIGSLTTVAMLPPAIIFGVSAGYFKGWVDDLIQYLYTTLTSIPGVLLIAACVLLMQVYIDTHPELFDTISARADLRLFMLCLILGLTGWAGLCRLLRAETMKLRELEYVQAAKAFGLGHLGIMFKHILPNLLHIVLITMVLEFSGLVLYEAILSYLGIGVDPSMPSFGTMIDASRIEMSRDPMIWWNLVTAFVFLLVLVLAANIFADAVQRAFDPRARRLSVINAMRLRDKETVKESL